MRTQLAAGAIRTVLDRYVEVRGRGKDAFIEGTKTKLILMGRYVDQGFGVLKTQSFRVLDRKLVATKVHPELREVVEFDGMPALEAYARALGVSIAEAAGRFSTHPLELLVGEEPCVRSPQQANGNTVRFYCAIDEGMELSLLESTDIVSDTERDLGAKTRDLGGAAAVVNTFAFSGPWSWKERASRRPTESFREHSDGGSQPLRRVLLLLRALQPDGNHAPVAVDRGFRLVVSKEGRSELSPGRAACHRGASGVRGTPSCSCEAIGTPGTLREVPALTRKGGLRGPGRIFRCVRVSGKRPGWRSVATSLRRPFARWGAGPSPPEPAVWVRRSSSPLRPWAAGRACPSRRRHSHRTWPRPSSWCRGRPSR